METKKDIRIHALQMRRALPAQVRAAYSREIIRLAAAHPLFVHAREIYCYAAFREEACTNGLIELAWEQGKRVALPRVRERQEMDFYYIEEFGQLKPGYQGILEPEEGLERAESVKEQAAFVLVVLPGAAFDKSGNRIGYGKGFYDRYLAAHPQYRRMGVAFSCQCVEQILSDPHDIRVEQVITEKGALLPC